MQDEKRWTVYGLEATGSVGAIRYVGITKHGDVARRVSGHLHGARKGLTSPVYDWIREMIDAGRKVRAVVLARTSSPDDEAAWITRLRADGFVLFNARAGGQNGGSFDEATKRRISDSNKATFARPEMLARRRGVNSPRAKLTEAQVLAVRARVAGGEMQKAVAAELGVHPTTVKSIVSRRIWKHI